MKPDPKTVFDGLQSGDLRRLSQMLEPVTPGDELELYMRGEAQEPGDEPDEDTIATGPAYERMKHRGDGVRSLYADPYVRVASGTVYALSHQCATDDHERRARFWEDMIELAQEAANAEWRLASGEVRE